MIASIEIQHCLWTCTVISTSMPCVNALHVQADAEWINLCLSQTVGPFDTCSMIYMLCSVLQTRSGQLNAHSSSQMLPMACSTVVEKNL
jgi:hypothetical protein